MLVRDCAGSIDFYGLDLREPAGGAISATASGSEIRSAGSAGSSSILCDFDHDLDIDTRDFALLGTYWNQLNPSAGDVGPASGAVPLLTPAPDGIVDFEDLFTFTRMWNWYYITLASLLSSDWTDDINICLGVANGDYVTKYIQKGRIKLKRLHNRKTYNGIKSWLKQSQASYNFAKILRNADKTKKGMILLEDDIILNPDWFSHTHEIIQKIEQISDEFILSIYSPHRKMEVGENGFTEYPIDRFFGTQGMYYPPSVAIKLGNFLRDDGYEPGHDVRAHQFCEDEKIKLYVPNRITIQHIGEKSAFHGTTLKKGQSPVPDYLWPTTYEMPHFHTAKKYKHQKIESKEKTPY